MTLRILYHHRTQGRGAEGVHIVSIVRALERMGHEVTVLSPPGIDPLTQAGEAPVDKSRVKTRGIHSVWKLMSRKLPNFLFEITEILYNLAAWRRLSAALKTSQYDLVYERYAFYLVAGALLARRRGIPFVLEANEVNGIAHRARPQSFPWLCAVFERMLFRRTASIHAVSSKLKEMILRQGVEGSRVHVTPNAFSMDRLGRVHRRRDDLLDRFGLRGKTVVGFAGWFDRWDRLDLLVDAAAKLKSRHPDLKLLLIGDGPVMPALTAQVERLGFSDSVIFTGAVSRAEVYDYISLLDVAVFSHSNDFGSPVVMFEFMGLSIPVVAPALPPILDVHERHDTALLFPPLDADACLRQIERLVESPELRASLAARAHDLLLRNHTWDSNARQILLHAGLSGPSAGRRRPVPGEPG